MALAIDKEIGGLAPLQCEDVVVEIYVVLVEALNVVQVQLDGVAVERREELRRDDIAVQYHLHVVTIYPLRHLAFACNNEEHIVDEGHVYLYTTQQIAQGTPISKTLLENGNLGILLIILLPQRVKTINICYYDIHINNILSLLQNAKIVKIIFNNYIYHTFLYI